MTPGNDLTLCTDEALLQRITQSNKDALIMLFDRYSADLYRYILPLVRTYRLDDQAEDDTKHILTAVFITLWDDRETLAIESTLSEHLYSEAYDRIMLYAGMDLSWTAASSFQAFEQ